MIGRGWTGLLAGAICLWNSQPDHPATTEEAARWLLLGPSRCGSRFGRCSHVPTWPRVHISFAPLRCRSSHWALAGQSGWGSGGGAWEDMGSFSSVKPPSYQDFPTISEHPQIFSNTSPQWGGLYREADGVPGVQVPLDTGPAGLR